MTTVSITHTEREREIDTNTDLKDQFSSLYPCLLLFLPSFLPQDKYTPKRPVRKRTAQSIINNRGGGGEEREKKISFFSGPKKVSSLSHPSFSLFVRLSFSICVTKRGNGEEKNSHEMRRRLAYSGFSKYVVTMASSHS